MERKEDILKTKYFKVHTITDLKDLVYQSAERYKNRNAFKLKDKEVYAPCNGTLEVLYPTGHAFAIRMKDNTGILVHIGINTVKLKGKGFTVFAKQGQEVKAGDKIVAVDLKTIKNAGLDDSVILIKTEEGSDPPVFKKKIGEVKAGDIIS